MTYEIERATDRVIRSLYSDGNPNKAVLSSARGAASMTNRRAQGVWPIMLANLDAKFLSRTGQPTHAEVAVYSAIHFYAIHQQGKTQFVYGPANQTDETKGKTLFSALADLRKNEKTRTALDRRVQPLLATTNVNSVINSIEHLVEILKASNWEQKIDYARLAQDLYRFQGSYEQANSVRLLWGQQYFKAID